MPTGTQWSVREMTLVDGEKINITMDQVCRQDQTLVRVGKNLVVGIHDKDDDSAVYIWKNVEGVYQYLGDTSLRENDDGTVTWNVVPSTGAMKGQLHDLAHAHHLKQARNFVDMYDRNNVVVRTSTTFISGIQGDVRIPLREE